MRCSKRLGMSKAVADRLTQHLAQQKLTSYKRARWIHQLVERLALENRLPASTDGLITYRRSPETTITIWTATIQLLKPTTERIGLSPIRLVENLITQEIDSHEFTR